jgi:PTS system fructose-specific IIC component
LVCKDKDEVLAKLVAAVARSGSVQDQQKLLQQVLKREGEANTAIGGGLAVPHARSSEVPRLQIAVATLARPLDTPSEDGKPVDIVMLIVGSEQDPRLMLRVLARLARLVNQSPLLEALRRASNPSEMSRAFATVK